MKISRLTLVGIVLLVAIASVGIASACAGGCTPGYWKGRQVAWPEGAIQPNDPMIYASIVGADLNGDGRADTNRDALDYKGGNTLEDAQRMLIRAAIATELTGQQYDAFYSDPFYPVWIAYVRETTERALVYGDRGYLLYLKNVWADENEQGCPWDAWGRLIPDM